MDTQKQQVAERIKQANNILVTVSSNPSVDQLAACIGLTLALNKLGKHATAVFSGQVPSTIEFLQPEKTIEKNTDSLRDFIIALDKAKADKLRYKVEDKVVKIFITPYKTSISEKDLEFSQGDFNVDVVVALGVHNQADLDQAITAHGRILHDAVVTTLNVKPGGELGAINWLAPGTSSLSELVVELIDVIDKKMIDGQMATALLTGIVAETQRFSNAKTSPLTMSISAELMAAGANQQLVATKLEEAAPKPPPPPPPPKPPVVPAPPKPAAPLMAQPVAKPKDDGTLEIDHGDKPVMDLSAGETRTEPLTPQIDIDREGTLRRIEEVREEQEKAAAALAAPSPVPSQHLANPRAILQSPPAGDSPTADAFSGGGNGAGNDPLSLPQPDNDPEERPSGAPPLNMPSSFSPLPQSNHVVAAPAPPPPLPPLDDASQPVATNVPPIVPPTPAGPPSFSPSGDDRTLSQIEQDVDSPHLSAFPPANPLAPPSQPPTDVADVSNARDAVHRAINAQASNGPQEPIAALNAQPVDLNLRDAANPVSSAPPVLPPIQNNPQPPVDPYAPPPVPPPMMPPPVQ